MNTPATIIHHLQEIFNGDPWYGDNISKKLSAITATEANWHPHKEAHSIAQVLKHMLNWKLMTISKLNNGNYDIEMNSNEDWDKELVVITEEEWQQLVAAFTQAQTELLDILAAKTTEDLQQNVNGRSYNMAYLAHGIYEHNIYHLGQIGYIQSLYTHIIK